MPHLAQVMRFRRERRARVKGRRRWGLFGLITAGAITLAAGFVAIALALTLSDLAASLPPVDDLERIFGAPGREAFRPVRVYDRTGDGLLFEFSNPAAETRRWIYLEPDGPIDLPGYAVQALITALDEDFWTHPGYRRAEAAAAIADYLFAPTAQAGSPTLTQRLAGAQLTPLELSGGAAAARVQAILLAAEITRRYPREQILEWYLNSANFGHQAYGIDSAALVYFGKHASDLSLGESAVLAPIPLDPGRNPLDQPAEAVAAQRSVLEAMQEAGIIDAGRAGQALRERLHFSEDKPRPASPLDEFRRYVLDRLRGSFGREMTGRSGLRVTTSLDLDLQRQAACTLESQLARLGGADADTVVPAGDAGCLAAGLLTPMRPKDAGEDHAVQDGALVVLDAGTGEVLSMVGGTEELSPAEPLFAPFVALTAFSQGYSPASMLLDVNPGTASSASVMEEHGPVRLRMALANNYQAALDRLLARVGLESVARTLNSLGLIQLGESLNNPDDAGGRQASLLGMSYAYSVFAGEGTLHGTETRGQAGEKRLEPIVILQIEDGTRRLIFQTRRQARALVSAQLSYLMVDILSDEAARWPSLGRGNPLEVGRPTAGLTGVSPDGTAAWTLGFTPQRVIGVRIGADDADGAAGLTALNASAPVWHAVMQYAARGQDPTSWRTPPGVSTLEVCDPSGLLPTIYCPSVVRETFINGTEPTNYDNLFQPYLVNRETGKLATLDTPLEMVEERVYMIVPSEASDWARQAGIPLPPQEYDTLRAEDRNDARVRITAPQDFDFLRGQVRVRGWADPEELRSYRLQYGRGLNPTQWVQIGGDETRPVRGGTLGTWDTGPLNGLFTLQLIVVESSGRLRTASVPVTIDNQPPAVEIELPLEGEMIEAAPGDEIVLQAGVEDAYGIARVVFYVDDEAVAEVTAAPWSTRWRISNGGEHEMYVEVSDLAGNSSISDVVAFKVSTR
jgi:membrane carboxypeptidase/penicillin-binding protein